MLNVTKVFTLFIFVLVPVFFETRVLVQSKNNSDCECLDICSDLSPCLNFQNIHILHHFWQSKKRCVKSKLNKTVRDCKQPTKHRWPSTFDPEHSKMLSKNVLDLTPSNTEKNKLKSIDYFRSSHVYNKQINRKIWF